MAFDSDYSSEDEEDVCPLCIEEMDISDKSFKPCRCGFQVCQFCYNNIRQSLEPHNRCPACRRPYTDEEIEWTQLTPAELKREQERKHRKEQERKQREREKNKEMTLVSDQRDKKNLSTIRVIQKNLVYVIGLNPNIPSDELQQMLRREEYFGQYGKIQKIVINRRVNAHGVPGIGVYVTFARKEDAARCIAAIDGVINDGKQLRAAYGTTKYCSNYLRGQNCPNTNCMYLHEPGEEVNTLNKKDHLLPHPSSASSTPSRPASSASGHPQHPQHSLHNPHNSHNPHLGPATISTASASNSALNPALSSASALGSGANSSGTVSILPQPSTTRPATPAQLVPAPLPIPTPAASISPPWGKTAAVLQNHGHKIASCDLLNPAATSIEKLDAALTAIVPKTWSVDIVFNSLPANTKFPAMFSLPMDEKRRLKVYNRAISELDKLDQQNAANAAANPANSANSATASTKEGNMKADPTIDALDMGLKEPKQEDDVTDVASVTGPKVEAAQTDQEIDQPIGQVDAQTDQPIGPPAPLTTQPIGQAGSQAGSQGSQTGSQAGSQTGSQATPQPAATTGAADHPAPKKKDPRKVEASLNSMIKSHIRRIPDHLSETMKQVGSAILQPVEIEKVKLTEADIDFSESGLIDDGADFEITDIPNVGIIGDTSPSVWAAISELSELRNDLSTAEREFSASKGQTRKRLKRIKV